jgi:glycosyltransferase involved in cell wall biosynthesis
VVRTGVDLNHYHPEGPHRRREARIQLGQPMAAPIVVCVGRVTRQKGQDMLLAGWPSIRDRHPTAILALVGDGPMFEWVRRQAVPGVALTGALYDPRPWYHAADVVVLPSRWEGLPLTMLEALAIGRSIVATAIPGIAEVLPPGAGALVPAEAQAAFAEAVCLRLCQPDLADAEGSTGARWAASNVDIRQAHDRLAAVTAQVAQSELPNRSR